MEMFGVFVLTFLAVCGVLTLARVPFLVARYRRVVQPRPTPELTLRPQGRDRWFIFQRSTQETFGPYTFRQANALLSWMQAGTADSRTREQVLEEAERPGRLA